MFDFIFLTKNQKLVKKWTKEHEKIVSLTNMVIAEYSKNNHKKAKKLLIELNNLVVDHVTDENIEFFKLQRDTENKLSNKNTLLINEFIKTFADVKKDLMKFLTKYTKKDTPLDDTFFDTLNKLAEILLERIKYEESKLYNVLKLSKEEQKWQKFKEGY